MGRLASDGFAKAEEDWTNSVMQWEKRRQAREKETKDGETLEVPNPPTRPASPMVDDAEEAGAVEGAEGKEGADTKGTKDKDAHPPAKKFRMTDQMKNIVWELVLLSNECCRLENEKKYVCCLSPVAES